MQLIAKTGWCGNVDSLGIKSERTKLKNHLACDAIKLAMQEASSRTSQQLGFGCNSVLKEMGK